MDTAAEFGRDPVSKHQIQPEYGDEQIQDCPTPSRETKFSGTTGDREIFIFPVQPITSRISKLTRLIHTLAVCVTIHHTKGDADSWPCVYVSKGAAEGILKPAEKETNKAEVAPDVNVASLGCFRAALVGESQASPKGRRRQNVTRDNINNSDIHYSTVAKYYRVLQ